MQTLVGDAAWQLSGQLQTAFGGMTTACGARRWLTRRDGDGVAEVGAVQLPGQLELALGQREDVLLPVLAPGHDKLLAI